MKDFLLISFSIQRQKLERPYKRAQMAKLTVLWPWKDTASYWLSVTTASLSDLISFNGSHDPSCPSIRLKITCITSIRCCRDACSEFQMTERSGSFLLWSQWWCLLVDGDLPTDAFSHVGKSSAWVQRNPKTVSIQRLYLQSSRSWK
jgi:hypothetical protein